MKIVSAQVARGQKVVSEYLRRLVIFKEFATPELASLAEKVYESRLASKQAIAVQGEPPNKAYFFRSGLVKRFRMVYLEAVSQETRSKFAKEISTLKFPIRCELDTVSSLDSILLPEILHGDVSFCHAVVEIPCEAYEINFSDCGSFAEMASRLPVPFFPTDDELIEKVIATKHWEQFKSGYITSEIQKQRNKNEPFPKISGLRKQIENQVAIRVKLPTLFHNKCQSSVYEILERQKR